MFEEHLVLRTLLVRDAAAVARLYAPLQKEAPWATQHVLAQALAYGGCRGGVQLGALCAAWLCVPTQAYNACAAFLRRCGAADDAACFILPPVCPAPFFEAFSLVCAAPLPPNSVLALPIKGAQKSQLHALFAAGFLLTAMRPLENLRPHYIFHKKQVQFSVKTDIIVSWNDTKSLSRYLANGYCCTGIQGGNAALVRMGGRTYESRNTG